MSCVHFIGFTDPARYRQAVSAFGYPDYMHRYWDGRAKSMIAPGDLAVFASGSEADTPKLYSFDDSQEN